MYFRIIIFTFMCFLYLKIYFFPFCFGQKILLGLQKVISIPGNRFTVREQKQDIAFYLAFISAA